MNKANESSHPTEPQAYLVTGGAGMLGRAIVSQLIERGKRVRIIDIERAKDERAEIIVGDIRDAAAVKKACDGVDTVIHSAAAVWDPRLPLSIYDETNAAGTQLIIDTCVQLGIRRMVYTSTMDVIMDGKHGHRLADESLPSPADPGKMNAYAHSKMLGEQAVIKANGPNFSTCALRLVGMYGPGDRYHLPNIIRNAKSGINIRMGDRRTRFSHVFSGNAAYAHILASEHLHPDSPVAGQFYFITDHDTGNFFDFMNPFLGALGIPLPRISIPYKLAIALAWFAEKLVPRSNFNRFSVYCLCKDHTFVHDKATRDFGYRPLYSADEAFKITVEWLKTQKF